MFQGLTLLFHQLWLQAGERKKKKELIIKHVTLLSEGFICSSGFYSSYSCAFSSWKLFLKNLIHVICIWQWYWRWAHCCAEGMPEYRILVTAVTLQWQIPNRGRERITQRGEKQFVSSAAWLATSVLERGRKCNPARRAQAGWAGRPGCPSLAAVVLQKPQPWQAKPGISRS